MSGGVLSRRVVPILAIGLLVSVAACASIAGIDGLDVDPCFDGCEENRLNSADSAAEDAPSSDGGTDTGTTLGDATSSDANTDDSGEANPCPCPTGTALINGTCAVTTKPSPFAQCAAPLKLRADCKSRVVMNVCQTDPVFNYEAACQGDGGAQRPTVFVQLGARADGGKWTGTINGPFNVASVNGACDLGTQGCAANGTAANGFTLGTGVPNTVMAMGKRDDANPCHDVTIDLSPIP